MQNDVTAQDSGITESAVETIESTEVQDSQTPKLKWVPKLLHKLNVKDQEIEEWKAKYESVVNQTVDQKLAERDRQAEAQNFLQTYWEETYKSVEKVLEQYPNLSYEDAYDLKTSKEQKQSYGIQGNVPRNVTEEVPLSKKSTEELKQLARQDLEAMWIKGRID